MTRVLVVGYDPDAVDFSDPALPPGLDAGKVMAGIEASLAAMRARGWDVAPCLVRPDATAVPMLEAALAAAPCDCVVIGAGVRLPPKSLPLFEALINAVHRAAPGAAIAFNTRPEDTAEAAARWVQRGSP